MSKLHWLVSCGKVICAVSPSPSVSRPRMSGPQLFSFEAETLGGITLGPVLLTTVKFCRAAPWTSALGPPPPSAAGAAGAGAGAAGAAGAGAAVLLSAGLGPALLWTLQPASTKAVPSSSPAK